MSKSSSLDWAEVIEDSFYFVAAVLRTAAMVTLMIGGPIFIILVVVAAIAGLLGFSLHFGELPASCVAVVRGGK